MKQRHCNYTVLCGAVAVLAGQQASGAVGLVFYGVGSTQTSASVAGGSNFAFSVKETESVATDQVSGVDYEIEASQNNVFEFLSRNSQVAGEQFTSANGKSDAQLQPAILNPTNGTDLGTSTGSGLALVGPNTYEVADYSFEVLPNTLPGIYTLSFVGTDYSGAPPNYPTEQLNTLGTYTVTVPEPAALSLFGIAGAAFLLRRRNQSIPA